jgi:hypothetical protein
LSVKRRGFADEPGFGPIAVIMLRVALVIPIPRQAQQEHLGATDVNGHGFWRAVRP